MFQTCLIKQITLFNIQEALKNLTDNWLPICYDYDVIMSIKMQSK